MNTLSLPVNPIGSDPDALFGLSVVAHLLDASSQSTMTPSLLRAINCITPASYISLVRYDKHGPRLIEGHALEGLRNITHDCWERYRGRFFRVDELTRLAWRMCSDGPVEAEEALAVRCQAEHIPDANWREQIYVRSALSDRLSLLYRGTQGNAYAVNVYRTQAQGLFEPDRLQQLLTLAPLVHRVLSHRVGAVQHSNTAQRTQQIELNLAARAPELSPREREVCARIACGLSMDGIAADLGIAKSSVLTLRKRAYNKLALHSRMDLVRRFH